MPEENKNSLKHLAFIMDGNRRWAKERNLPTFEGHMKGYEVMIKLPEWFFAQGVETISFYAFSTENWNRSQDEVNYLMKLLKKGLTDNIDNFMEKGYRIFLSGRLDDLPGDLPQICFDAMSRSINNTKGNINICLNYGGRAEIVDVIQKIIKNNVDISQVHEGMVRKYLYSSELTDPDMIIRTSGEQRLSGFMLWQSAYSELFFMKKYWPEMEKSDVDVILSEYNSRKRRFGG